MGATAFIILIRSQKPADPYGHTRFSLETSGREWTIPEKRSITSLENSGIRSSRPALFLKSLTAKRRIFRKKKQFSR
jgi:hypothetical protein